MFSLIAQGTFGGFWSLVLNSGPMGQLVMLVLLFFSVFSWSIVFKKVRFYKEAERQSQNFYDEFRRTSNLSTLYQDCQRFPNSPLAGIFKSGFEELTQQINATQPEEATPESSESLKSLNGLERTLQKASQTEMTTLEDSLSWLATTGAVTPFIGLFGTVIGIINAFQGLGQGTTTTIQAVAPGISEALVATAGGLFAAIPAVIAYNHFVNRLKVFGVEMDDFSTEFLNTVERSFM